MAIRAFSHEAAPVHRRLALLFVVLWMLFECLMFIGMRHEVLPHGTAFMWRVIAAPFVLLAMPVEAAFHDRWDITLQAGAFVVPLISVWLAAATWPSKTVLRVLAGVAVFVYWGVLFVGGVLSA